MRHLLWICAILALSTAACSSSRANRPPTGSTPECDNLALRLDRSDWMVNKGTSVSKVMAHSAPNRPPEHIGYLVERKYRQMRGGPQFTMYSVTTTNRDEQVGHVDQMGRATRYEPRRNGSFDPVALGSNSLELNVQAIFDTMDRVTFEPTNEREIAFAALDLNGDGLLQNAETRTFGDRIANADSNGDGVVDYQEFNAIDVL